MALEKRLEECGSRKEEVLDNGASTLDTLLFKRKETLMRQEIIFV